MSLGDRLQDSIPIVEVTVALLWWVFPLSQSNFYFLSLSSRPGNGEYWWNLCGSYLWLNSGHFYGYAGVFMDSQTLRSIRGKLPKASKGILTTACETRWLLHRARGMLPEGTQDRTVGTILVPK